MSYAIQSRPASGAGHGAARRFAAGLRAALREVWRELVGAWRYGVARREFAQLDDSTLRDIGISRGEFDSYWAETHGQAEPTRARVNAALEAAAAGGFEANGRPHQSRGKPRWRSRR